MVDAKEVIVDANVTNSDGVVATVKKIETIEEATKRITELEEASTKNEELLKKLRKFEKENAAAAEANKLAADKALVEQGKYKELYEAEHNLRKTAEDKIKSKELDSAIMAILKDSEAKSSSTVMKLIDRDKITFENDVVDTKSIEKIINELKLSDPILFGKEPKPQPDVKKAGEGDVTSSYLKELKACTTQKQIETVMKKFGKL